MMAHTQRQPSQDSPSPERERSRQSRQLRVAVVGSGLAGLTTAYLLRLAGVTVYLIERSDKLGFHSASIEIPIPTERKSSVEPGSYESGHGQSSSKGYGDDQLFRLRDNTGPSSGTEMSHSSQNPGGQSSSRRRRRRTAEASNEAGSGVAIHPSKQAMGPTSSAQKWTIDVPMRSFQGGYYPLLIALYRHLGIPLARTRYTFSFAHLRSSSIPPRSQSRSKPGNSSTAGSTATTTETYFIHSGSSGFSFPSLPSRSLSPMAPLTFLYALLTWLAMAGAYLLLLALSFLAHHDLLPSLISPTIPLSEFSTHIASFLAHPLPLVYTPFGLAWTHFVDTILIPLFSSVGTMPASDVLAMPVRYILEYVHATFGTDHYTPSEGYSAGSIAEKLVKKVESQGEGYVRLGAKIVGMEYKEGGVEIRLTGSGSTAEEGRAQEEEEILFVDKVVVATQASAAHELLGMLESSFAKNGEKAQARRVSMMRRGLETVEYREAIVINHRDFSILPPKADQRDLNFIQSTLAGSSSKRPFAHTGFTLPERAVPKRHSAALDYFPPQSGSVYTMATHIMRPPRHLRGLVPEVLQTTNPVVPISPDSILSIARLERALPLRDPRILDALHPLSSTNTAAVYLAGSYAYPGIPLLEGCVGSAKRAVEAILEDWQRSQGERDEHGEKLEYRKLVDDAVDWDAGKGGVLGRLWRWKRK